MNILLSHGADVNLRDSNGNTPLMYRVRKRFDKDILTILMDHGADINAQDKQGNTALMIAALADEHMLADLLDAGADINMQVLYAVYFYPLI